MRWIDPSKNLTSGDWRLMSNPLPLPPLQTHSPSPIRPPKVHATAPYSSKERQATHLLQLSAHDPELGPKPECKHTPRVPEFPLIELCGQFNLEAQRWWLIAWELGGVLLNETWRSVCVSVTDRWMGLWVYLGLLSFIFPLLFDLTCYLLFPFFAVIHTLALLQMPPQIFESISADVTEKDVWALWELSSSHRKRWPCAWL